VVKDFLGRVGGGNAMVIARAVVVYERIGGLAVHPKPFANRSWVVIHSAEKRSTVSSTNIRPVIGRSVDMSALRALTAGGQTGYNLFSSDVEVKCYWGIPVILA
jgi:hypothetical protein